jgi:hypothetical protein
MHISPKMMAAVKAVFGWGFGFLGILVTEHPRTVLPMVILGSLAGIAWAGGLVYWWNRSKRLYAASLTVLLVFVIVATIIGFPIAATCAMGGYGLALLIAIQVKESRYKERITWQDLRGSSKGKTLQG